MSAEAFARGFFSELEKTSAVRVLPRRVAKAPPFTERASGAIGPYIGRILKVLDKAEKIRERVIKRRKKRKKKQESP